jgi:DNA segregation ATPase FtsK/SpoIIIE, S-DNA-T family
MSGLSIYDPIYLGIDENRDPVSLDLVYRNILIAGEPGAGKSVLMQNILGHAALCGDARLVLLDGKRVELGMWAGVADVFVGPDQHLAIAVLEWLQAEIDRRTDALAAYGLRKLERRHGVDVLLVAVDEIAFYSATVGDKKTQERFVALLRDVVARGRAVGITTVAATQRPSADIIPTSLRDIFGYRCAFRCTTHVSSDIVLGFGWAELGYSAYDIAPDHHGIGYLLAEEAHPVRFRSAYLTDADIDYLADHALALRHADAALLERRAA